MPGLRASRKPEDRRVVSVAQKRWRERNPDAVRRINKKQKLRRYGLTLDKFTEILKIQSYRCGICPSSNPGGKGDWHVDHDHRTGEVRGLLCHSCNLGLGFLKDDVGRLDAAKEYLSAPPAKRAI